MRKTIIQISALWAIFILILWALFHFRESPKLKSFFDWASTGGVATILGFLFLICLGLTHYIWNKERRFNKALLASSPLPELNSITSILQRMDKRNRELAKEQKVVKLRYDIITEDYLDVFGYKLKPCSDKKDMTKQLAKLRKHIRKVFPRNILRADSSNIMYLGSVYECMGFGLRKQREADIEYKDLTNQLATSRNPIIDTKANSLTEMHVIISECYSNFLLLEKLPESDRQDLMQLFPQNFRISWFGGGVETEINEALQKIRINIGERIRKLEVTK